MTLVVICRDSGFADDSRSFNRGSYNHSMKECPKPRDNAAVKNARKQHKTKRNQNPNSRNRTRYYQNTPSGKYDGLKPGVLEAETRRLLGLGELDPPPWLVRMREIGYPPEYLDGYQPSCRFVIPSDSISRDQFRESRWARDLRDDCSPRLSTSIYSHSSRYASYGPTNSFQSPRRDAHPSRSTGSERSEREGRSPMQQRNVVAHVSYDSQNHPSRPVSEDHKKYGDGRDPYFENLARHGHREGRRHMRR
uniref:PSP proline-rich domain-containing protein n=1 Tax=Kalanchoe fedtschenkoi TaxID=63787 RepID=A0A7N0TCS1_KALFE